MWLQPMSAPPASSACQASDPGLAAAPGLGYSFSASLSPQVGMQLCQGEQGEQRETDPLVSTCVVCKTSGISLRLPCVAVESLSGAQAGSQYWPY